jgi:hypothetical protein
MPERELVEFVGDAATELATLMKTRLKGELKAVFEEVSTTKRPPEAITVSRCFSGYTQDMEEKVVLGVEVRYPGGTESHIVKVGVQEEVKVDYDGWNSCTEGRTVSSRIFAPVRPVELPDNRYAVLYRDAYTLFGLNREKNQPLPLQSVARWAVVDDRPGPDSVERVIAQIYTDLGVWLYPGATVDKELAVRFYRDHLGMDIGDSDPKKQHKRILLRWKEEFRQRLRRDAVWVLCGRDKPTADPKNEPARYLDPVEFVEWVLADSKMDRLPDTLVGRAHGDLHALNVLVGVRRGEAEFPVVFDYGEMKPTNVLVWDFVKLEMELKVRLLPSLLYDAAVCERLLADSRLRPKSKPSASTPCSPERPDRLRAFLAFEEQLHDLTSRIESKEDAEPIRPLCPLPTGLPKLDRLLGLLLRIRKEAAIWLGFDQPKRQHRWRDEYGFALAVYGLLNVKWDYEPPQAECALVSAGVAIARMPSTPDRLVAEIDSEAQHPAGTYQVASYRVPLAVLHRFWSAKGYEQAQRYVEQMVLDVKQDKAGRLERFLVRPQVSHAIPLIAEAALIEIEFGHLSQAEELLKEFRRKAVEFGDYETLGRIGRLFKDSGDRRWAESPFSFDKFRGTPGWQMYQQAKQVYQEAFEATDDYYTGINAATLALLTHDLAAAQRDAQRVADLCAAIREIPPEDRPWVFATEGEAALILGKREAAIDHYKQALRELLPGDGGKADSMYKQLCRLSKALGDDRVGPVLKVFETSEFAPMLTHEFRGPGPSSRAAPADAASNPAGGNPSS